MKNQELSGGFQPLSPQLRFSLRQKQPPRTTLPLSRTVAQPLAPSPPFQELISNPSYVLVPTLWCIDYVVPVRSSYLSRGKLLREMYKRMVHYRSFNSKDAKEVNNVSVFMQGIEILGPPLDYWLTFPLQQPANNNSNQECKIFSGLPEDFKEDELACGWVIGPVKCSRKMLNIDVGVGQLPADNRLTFPWVTNSNSTNFLPLDHIMMLNDNFDIRRNEGFMECIKCGEIIGIAYLLPARFHVVVKHIFEKMDDFITDSSKVLRVGGFGCNCDGILKPTLPIISENLRKINWLFLFYGITLGLCTAEQLRYFCNQRKASSSGNKNELLRFVCLDICAQIDPESSFRDAAAAGSF